MNFLYFLLEETQIFQPIHFSQYVLFLWGCVVAHKDDSPPGLKSMLTTHEEPNDISSPFRYGL